MAHDYIFVNHDLEMEQERDDEFRRLDGRVHDPVLSLRLVQPCAGRWQSVRQT